MFASILTLWSVQGATLGGCNVLEQSRVRPIDQPRVNIIRVSLNCLSRCPLEILQDHHVHTPQSDIQYSATVTRDLNVTATDEDESTISAN